MSAPALADATVLGDVLEVIAEAGAGRLGLAAIRDGLTLLRPRWYHAWTDDTLAGVLARHGIQVEPVRCPHAGHLVLGARAAQIDGARP